MKRIITLTLLVLSLFVCTACTKDETKKDKTENLSRNEQTQAQSGEDSACKKPSSQEGEGSFLSGIKDEITKAIGAKDYLDFNKDAITNLYSIDAKDIKDCAGFSVMEGTFPHEVVMIEATDEEASLRISEAFNVKIENFSQQSKNYDAENYALAQKCKVIKNGNFYALFLSPDYEDIKAVYEKHIK